eukprot:PhF_6_TR16592/c0_g1_i1/m.25284
MREALLFTNVLTHVTIIPCVLLLFQRRWFFDSYVLLYGTIVSAMYHTCEALETPLWLSELQWHRLDNIGGLACFAMFFLYLCDVRHPGLNSFLRFFSITLIVVCQEKAPWVVFYTVVPFLTFCSYPILIPLLFRVPRPQYNPYMLRRGFGMLGVGVIFFVRGLDDAHDPGRMYHGLWHVIAGSSSYFLWNIVASSSVGSGGGASGGGGAISGGYGSMG